MSHLYVEFTSATFKTMITGFQGLKILLHFFVWWMMFTKSISTNPLMLLTADDVRLGNILVQFRWYDFVVHVDQTKMHFLSTLGSIASPTNPVTIFKYTEEEYLFHRPLVYRCVHYVVQDDDGAFLEHYSLVEGNVEETDVVIFLSKTLDTTRNYTKLYNTGVDHANIAYFLNRTHGNAILFYNSPDGMADVRPVRRTENDEPILDIHNAFMNFRGFPLKIGYTNCMPFVYQAGPHIIGVEFKIMEVVVAALNFTPYYEDYSQKTDGRLMLINDVGFKDSIDFDLIIITNFHCRSTEVY